MASSLPPGQSTAKCPVCGRPAITDYRPFCSRRCAEVDLARWLRGSYAIPDVAASEDGDEGEPADGGSGEDGKKG